MISLVLFLLVASSDCQTANGDNDCSRGRCEFFDGKGWRTPVSVSTVVVGGVACLLTLIPLRTGWSMRVGAMLVCFLFVVWFTAVRSVLNCGCKPSIWTLFPLVSLWMASYGTVLGSFIVTAVLTVLCGILLAIAGPDEEIDIEEEGVFEVIELHNIDEESSNKEEQLGVVDDPNQFPSPCHICPDANEDGEQAEWSNSCSAVLQDDEKGSYCGKLANSWKTRVYSNLAFVLGLCLY